MTSSNCFETVLIVDPTVANYQSLVSSVDRATKVIVLDAVKDGVEQITVVLADLAGVTQLHVLSHGNAGSLQLGSTQLNQQTLSRYVDRIRGWGRALTNHASILLYGCQVAASQAGQQFVQQLKSLTGAEVAAATTLVGSAALGGTWNLISTAGQRATPVFTAAAMESYPFVLVETDLNVLLNESFTGTDVNNNTAWLYGIGKGTTSVLPYLTARPTPAPSLPAGLPGNQTGGPTDPDGQGALRLTNNNNNQAAFVLYNRPIDETAGLKITFNLFSYGGRSSDPSVPAGADGLTFFLVNGTANPTGAGAFGGSLGYAQKQAEQPPIAGVLGGYLGIGLDEYGNFSSPTDFPNGPQQRVGGPGQVRDSVSIRGSQATQYAYLTGTQTLPFSIDNVAPGANRSNSGRQVEIDLSPTGVLTVSIDKNLVINQDITKLGNSLPPSTVKFGFAAGTGVSTNFHEVTNLVIAALPRPITAPLSQEVPPSSDTNLLQLKGTATATGATITSYTIVRLPPTNQGVLYLGNPSSGGTRVTAGQNLSPSQINQLYFMSTPGFNGSSFTYTATDSNKNTATPSTFTLGLNERPLVYNTTISKVRPNTTVQAQAPIDTANNPKPPVANLRGPIGTDTDSSPVASYTILGLPSTKQGVLYLGNPTSGGTRVTANQVLTPTQIGGLYFKASRNFTQKATVKYTATDTLGVTAVNPANITFKAATSQPGKRIIFKECPDSTDLITNFKPAKDLIDLTALFNDCPGGANLYERYIQVSDTNKGALVSVGDGQGHFTPFAVLQNVAPQQVHRSNFLL
jgi:hypothetical protein